MKKLLIILFILSGKGLVYGQYQSMFGMTETSWIVKYSNTYFENKIDSAYHLKDTIVSITNYSIVRFENSGDAWIKEDTVLGKAWEVNNVTQQNISLIYDLNLQVGDNFQIPYSNILGQVDSVYYVLGRKYIRLTPVFVESEFFYMIEGVGLASGFFNYSDFNINKYRLLTCHFKDGQLNYNWGGPCIPPGAYTNVNELNSEHFNLSPNPSNGHVALEIPENVKVLEINVLNMQGQVVFHQKGTANELNLSFLEGGNYIVHIETSEGFTYSKICIAP
jgi:hypothetical protein